MIWDRYEHTYNSNLLKIVQSICKQKSTCRSKEEEGSIQCSHFRCNQFYSDELKNIFCKFSVWGIRKHHNMKYSNYTDCIRRATSIGKKSVDCRPLRLSVSVYLVSSILYLCIRAQEEEWTQNCDNAGLFHLLQDSVQLYLLQDSAQLYHHMSNVPYPPSVLSPPNDTDVENRPCTDVTQPISPMLFAHKYNSDKGDYKIFHILLWQKYSSALHRIFYSLLSSHKIMSVTFYFILIWKLESRFEWKSTCNVIPIQTRFRLQNLVDYKLRFDLFKFQVIFRTLLTVAASQQWPQLDRCMYFHFLVITLSSTDVRTHVSPHT